MFESEFYCNCSLLVTFYLYMLTLSCLITLLHPKSDLLCSACGVSLWEGSRLPGWANCGPTVPAITGFAVSACGDILIGQLQNLGRTLCRGLGHRMPPPPPLAAGSVDAGREDAWLADTGKVDRVARHIFGLPGKPSNALNCVSMQQEISRCAAL